jgi:hypothetical protein
MLSRLIRDYPITTAYGGIAMLFTMMVHVICTGWVG